MRIQKIKIVWQGLSLALIGLVFALSLSINGVEDTSTFNQPAQASNTKAIQTKITVKLPERAILHFKEDKSDLHGRLISFNSQNLVIEGGTQHTIILSDAKSLEFTGDVWIDGSSRTRRRPSTIHSQTEVWPPVPTTALELLQNPPISVKVELGKTFSPAKKKDVISANVKNEYVLKKIVFLNPNSMELYIQKMPRE